ncbi:Mu transposase C-terminal domain-containing protein [Algiphilus sp.]|uniref:Mu transposase C-terminal domain-containing protein n=1 Tax=Algiphilus sp. TaxID=1872431 RepID=UPI0025B84AEE|nr:Mu transposase C-terminal domain-containing protein [Abyssibacter sp.]MCK5859358.1 Mu transposase C-terminal domain-containing protein [Abyssibacter sp.]
MRKLDRQNGIRIHGQRYLPNKPISPEFYGHTYIVKFDPLDITYIYVSLGGTWTDFCHQYAHQFSGLSSARLAGYSREIVELAQRHEAASPERAEQLGALLERVAQIPHDPLAQWEESRIVRNAQKEEVMEGEPVSPFAIHGDIHSCPTFQSGDE